MNQASEVTVENATKPELKPEALKIKLLVLTVGINMIITICSLYVYDHVFAQKIAVFDKNRYINHVKEEYIKGNITNEDLNDVPKKVKMTIDSVNKNTTVLIGEAVLKNGKYIEVSD